MFVISQDNKMYVNYYDIEPSVVGVVFEQG